MAKKGLSNSLASNLMIFKESLKLIVPLISQIISRKLLPDECQRNDI